MSDEPDWIYEFMSKSEADAMEADAEKIERINSTLVTLILTAPMESVVDVVKTWDRAVAGDLMAWARMSEFTESLVEHMRDHLDEEGVL